MARNSYVGELCAGFAGTVILILFGVGVVAQVVTAPDGSLGDLTETRDGAGRRSARPTP